MSAPHVVPTWTSSARAEGSRPEDQAAATSSERHASDGHLAETLQAETLRAEIAARFTEREAVVAKYGPEFSQLWRLAAEQAQGGKLVRPLLLVGAYRAMSAATGTAWADDDELLRLASALELLHFAFLLHDDVIDGDHFRRGTLNLVGTLSAQRETGRHQEEPRGAEARPTPEGLHWGQTGAILTGDLVLAQVHQIVARSRVPHEVRERLLDLLDHAITETVAGEHADVALSDGIVARDLEAILATAVRKTATYTFGLPLRMAATLAGAPCEWQDRLDAAASHLGLAFQLQDDYLSTFGDAARHGKDPFSDLREGKETAIIAYARLTSAWPLVSRHIGNRGLDEATAADVVEALRGCGADRFVLGLVAEHRRSLATLLEGEDGSAGGSPSAPALPASLRTLLATFDAELEGRES